MAEPAPVLRANWHPELSVSALQTRREGHVARAQGYPRAQISHMSLHHRLAQSLLMSGYEVIERMDIAMLDVGTGESVYDEVDKCLKWS